jgi:sulfur carrier protein ThiS
VSKIKVTITPARGKSTTVEVDATHATLAAALKASGHSLSGFNATVNGEPATGNTAVNAKSKVVLTEKAAGS